MKRLLKRLIKTQAEEGETKKVVLNFEDCVSIGIIVDLDEQDETFTWVAIVNTGKPEVDTFLVTTRISELISVTEDASDWDAPMPAIRVDANIAYGPDVFEVVQQQISATGEFVLQPESPDADTNYFMGLVDYEPTEGEPIIKLSDYRPMDLSNYWEEEDLPNADEEQK